MGSLGEEKQRVTKRAVEADGRERSEEQKLDPQEDPQSSSRQSQLGGCLLSLHMLVSTERTT